MQHFTLSTDTVPERDRFDWWQDSRESFTGFTGARVQGDERKFQAHVEGWVGNSFGRFKIQSTPENVIRGTREIARLGLHESMWLYRDAHAFRIETQGQEHFVRRGEVLVYDPESPAAGQPVSGECKCDIWTLPRALVCSYLPTSAHRPTLSLAGQVGMHGLVQEYLSALSQRIDALTDAEGEVAVDVLCRLVAVAYGAAAGEHRSAFRIAKLAAAKRYIDRHLGEELTPAGVAMALRISTRQLHLLFEPTGTSFGQYLLGRRLAECKAILESPFAADRTTSDIAFARGFGSLASFYRAFRHAYGAPPGEFRNG